ncbi:hypothetical protein ABPG73_011075 [Tetrahymena malaccensis]
MLYSPPKEKLIDGKYKNEWAILMDLQRQEQQKEQFESNFDEKMRKQKYKEELDKMMNNQKEMQMRMRDHNEYLNKIHFENDQKQNINDLSRQNKIKEMAQQCNYTNFNEIQLKNEKFSQERNAEVQQMKQIINQAQRQQSEENSQKMQQKIRIVHELSDAYRQQELMKAQEKEKIKQEDKKLMEAELQKLNNYEMNRKQFFDKIKGGYQQNNKILEYYDNLYKRKMEDQKNFEINNVDKVIRQKQLEQEERELQDQYKRKQINKETYDTILYQINIKKEQAQKEAMMNQNYQKLLDENSKEYQQQMRVQNEINKNKQQDYLGDLKNQMEIDQQKRKLEGYMNPIELCLNRQQLDQYNSPIKEQQSKVLHTPIVPGLSGQRDFQRQKQMNMIDNQLGLQRSADQYKNARNFSSENFVQSRLNQSVDNINIFQTKQNNNNIYCSEYGNSYNTQIAQMQNQQPISQRNFSATRANNRSFLAGQGSRILN